MDLQEITDLIAIRQYVANTVANPTIDRPTVNYVNNILIMLDKKIIAILKNDEFKAYINYQDIQQSIADVARITNIKSGLRTK